MSVAAVTIRNESGVRVVQVEVPRPVSVIKVGVPGPQGVPGPSGSSVPAVHFSYGDATPDTLYEPSSDQVIKSVTIVVEQPFNGTGAKVSIGTDADHELLMAEEDSDLTIASTFETSPGEVINAGTPIKHFITPGAGASQGQCMVLFEYAEA